MGILTEQEYPQVRKPLTAFSNLFLASFLGHFEAMREEPSDQSYMYNQAVGLSCCHTKVQDSMVTHLKVIQSDRSKGQSASKVHKAAEELDYLNTFNRSITQAMVQSIHDSESVIIIVANLTLARQDSYMDNLKALNSTPQCPQNCTPRYECKEKICHHEDKRSAGPSHKKAQCLHPFSQSSKWQQESDEKSSPPVWKQLRRRGQKKKDKGQASNYQQHLAKGQKSYK